jgi:hypothetical protein
VRRLSALLLLAAFACAARAQAQTPAPDEPRIAHPIPFAADTLDIVFSDSLGDSATLTRNARVTYDDATLDAYRLVLSLDDEEVTATGLLADSGLVGRPAFARTGEAFTSERIAFRFATERGRFEGAQTAFDDGFLKARVVGVGRDSVVLARDGVYTTCECVEDPSYSLHASRLKIEDEWIYTGPIQLYLFNIPTPLVLPFGVLPNVDGRRAGPTAVDYGEDRLGFFLRGLGWYWPLSDYYDVTVQGDLYTSGSWEVRPRLRYARRYAYSGGLELAYGRIRTGESTDRLFETRTNARVIWNHNQTIEQDTRLNASVNLATVSALRNTSTRLADRVTQTVSSNVSYSTRLGRRSLNVNLSQNQTISTGAANLTLPSVSFSQPAVTPFRRRGVRGSEPAWYESIQTSYTGRLDNRFSFTPLQDTVLVNRGDPEAAELSWYEALLSPSRFRRATGQGGTGYDFTANHRVPVSASFNVTRLPLLGALNATVSPSIDYEETWFAETERQRVDTSGVLQREAVTGFFALREVSGNLSASTSIYGLFPVRVGALDGLRHTIRPTVGLSYSPDLFAPGWGYTRTYVDARGETQRYGIVRGVTAGERAALTFRADNVFETRRVREDTLTGDLSRSPLTLLNAGVSASYNFAADSLRLSNIQVALRTNLGEQFDANLGLTFNPYEPFSRQTTFDLGRARLARLTNVTLRVNGRFTSGRIGEARPSQRFESGGLGVPTRDADLTDVLPGAVDAAALNTTLLGAPYADFSIPWSLNADLTYNLTRNPQRLADGSIVTPLSRTATLGASFDFSLTPNLKINGGSGFDLLAVDVTTTRLSLLRDFECWEASATWVPFGQFESYGFTLQVKSGKLRELLRLEQPRSEARPQFDAF